VFRYRYRERERNKVYSNFIELSSVLYIPKFMRYNIKSMKYLKWSPNVYTMRDEDVIAGFGVYTHEKCNQDRNE
jgi:hypothetical protein